MSTLGHKPTFYVAVRESGLGGKADIYFPAPPKFWDLLKAPPEIDDIIYLNAAWARAAPRLPKHVGA